MAIAMALKSLTAVKSLMAVKSVIYRILVAGYLYVDVCVSVHILHIRGGGPH